MSGLINVKYFAVIRDFADLEQFGISENWLLRE